MYLTRGRLWEEQKELASAATSLQRKLTAWTPKDCYLACVARLDNPPTFLFNIYNNETTGVPVCMHHISSSSFSLLVIVFLSSTHYLLPLPPSIC